MEVLEVLENNMPNFKLINEHNIKTAKSGFKKDQGNHKLRYDLIPHELLTRLAEVYTKGAEKYPEENWRLATKQDSYSFKKAAWRHFIQWIRGDKDEDHALQLVWNIFSWVWINDYKK